MRLTDDFLKPGRNSIGFLRLLLASTVVYEHCYVLAGKPVPTHMAAKLAVDGFFLLSGLLVAQSFLNCSSFWDYLWRRSLRILPGYWVCIIVSALGFGLIGWTWQHGHMSGYWGGPDSPQTYILRGIPLFGHRGKIRDVFAANPYPSVMNGSLWTLPVEYLCYLVLGILGVIGTLRKPLALAIIAAFVALPFMFPALRLPTFGLYAPSQLTDANVLELYAFFALGALLHSFRERVGIPAWLGGLGTTITVAMLLVEYPDPGFQFASRIIRLVALPACLLWLAGSLPFTKIGVKTDLSYGTYIYSFPLTQLLVLMGVGSRGGGPLFFRVYAASLILAFASWKLVELPALRWKSALKRRKPVLHSDHEETSPMALDSSPPVRDRGHDLDGDRR